MKFDGRFQKNAEQFICKSGDLLLMRRNRRL